MKGTLVLSQASWARGLTPEVTVNQVRPLVPKKSNKKVMKKGKKETNWCVVTGRQGAWPLALALGTDMDSQVIQGRGPGRCVVEQPWSSCDLGGHHIRTGQAGPWWLQC